MEFDLYPVFLVALLVGGVFWLKKIRKDKTKSVLRHSLAAEFLKPEASLRLKTAHLPKVLMGLGALILTIALLDPHKFVPREGKDDLQKRDPTEGRILLFAVDQSGSMREKSARASSKLDLMKASVKEMIQKRQTDLIGLMAFARAASILSPPTLGHKAVLDDLEKIKVVTSPELDGTAIGYAILKGATLIASLKEQAESLGKKAPYQIEGSAIILVTDGLQDPNPLDRENPSRSIEVEQAAKFAKEKGVKVYIVNIEPKLASVKYVPNLREMRKVAELTGGAFYFAGSSGGLEEFLDKIDTLETATIWQGKNPVLYPTLFKRISYYKELIFIGLTLLALGFFLRETLYRRVT